jgi:hypothetical protein
MIGLFLFLLGIEFFKNKINELGIYCCIHAGALILIV